MRGISQLDGEEEGLGERLGLPCSFVHPVQVFKQNYGLQGEKKKKYLLLHHEEPSFVAM